MFKLLREYISLILKAVKVEDKEYLFISLPKFLTYFKNIFIEEANKYNLKEVYINEVDVFKKHDLMKELSQEEINNNPYFDNSVYNKYALLDAAFVFIESNVPNLMNDIDPIKIKLTSEHVRSTEKDFRNLYENNKLNWCIAGAANSYWASDLNMEIDDLWKYIFDICLVDGISDSYIKWQDKIKLLNLNADKLNNYHFKYLKYSNSLGTDLTVYLPKGHIWSSGDENGVLVNLPTEEVFTSPDYLKTTGIVYSSKPLIYNNVTINNFWLKFQDGKVVDFDALEGKEVLKGIIEFDDYSCYLGECALVSYNSPINNTGIIFKETLYDENASCHLALGTGFSECVRGGLEKENESIRELGVNFSKTHVDFMIGTRDLKVIGVTEDNREIIVIENGNIII